MSQGVGPPFHPGELAGVEDDEAVTTTALVGLAHELERLGSEDPAPSVGFADRVMSAVAAEPSPLPLAAAGRALRLGRPRALATAIGDAWRVAVGGGRPWALRAQAAVLVLAAAVGGASLTGVAVVGASALLTPPTTPAPLVSAWPSPSPSPSAQGPVPPSPEDEASPSASEEPSETPEPSGSPEATTKAVTPGPTRTAEPTHAPESTHAPEPTHTPEPTETPESSHSPWPTESPWPAGSPQPTSSGDAVGGG